MPTKRKSGPSGKHLRPQLQIRPDSTAQKRRWEAAAKRDGRTLSSWIRKRLDDAADVELAAE